MRRLGASARAVISVALWPLVVIFSPVIVLAGEPVNWYVLRRIGRSAAAEAAVVHPVFGPAPAAAPVRLPRKLSLLVTVISNPLWIALTAPGRWVHDRFRL
jgi:hypothetical protein